MSFTILYSSLYFLMVYPFGVLPIHQHLTFYLKFRKRLSESLLSMIDILIQTLCFLNLKYSKYQIFIHFNSYPLYINVNMILQFITLKIFKNSFGNVHKYGTRRSTKGNLYLKQIHTTRYGIRSVKYTGSILWNDLPVSIRKVPSLSIFKNRLKEYYFKSYHDNCN